MENQSQVKLRSRPQELFLMDIGKFYILNKSRNWTFLLNDFFSSPSSLLEFVFLDIFPCITVNSLISGHPRELEKVSVGRIVHLRELFP